MISLLQRGSLSARRAGISVGDDSIAVALVERDGEALRLRHCSVSDQGGNNWSRRTTELTSGLELRRVPVTAVVTENAYQLVLVECPQVPDEEVADAVRWRIKDLIGFSVDDAVIDTIDIPTLAHQSSRPMVYAIAAEAAAIARQVDAVTNAGLCLDSIDIPEMCLHNIAVCLPQEARGVALLHLEQEHGTLILSRGGILYLIRRIDTGRRAVQAMCAGELSLGDVASDIALELQRSLDYFESHYDQRPITQIVLGPDMPEKFSGILAEQLGLSVTELDLNAVLDSAEPIAAGQQSAAIIAIGAALRSQSAHTSA